MRVKYLLSGEKRDEIQAGFHNKERRGCKLASCGIMNDL
jgi:hypothetical protein